MTEYEVVWNGTAAGPNRGLLRMAAHPLQNVAESTIPTERRAKGRWLRSIVLERLNARQAVLSAKEIGETFGIDRGTVSDILRKMRKDGSIEIVATHLNAPVYRLRKKAA